MSRSTPPFVDDKKPKEGTHTKNQFGMRISLFVIAYRQMAIATWRRVGREFGLVLYRLAGPPIFNGVVVIV